MHKLTARVGCVLTTRTAVMVGRSELHHLLQCDVVSWSAMVGLAGDSKLVVGLYISQFNMEYIVNCGFITILHKINTLHIYNRTFIIYSNLINCNCFFAELKR